MTWRGICRSALPLTNGRTSFTTQPRSPRFPRRGVGTGSTDTYSSEELPKLLFFLRFLVNGSLRSYALLEIMFQKRSQEALQTTKRSSTKKSQLSSGLDHSSAKRRETQNGAGKIPYHSSSQDSCCGLLVHQLNARC
jgi:hypothetical protein